MPCSRSASRHRKICDRPHPHSRTVRSTPAPAPRPCRASCRRPSASPTAPPPRGSGWPPPVDHLPRRRPTRATGSSIATVNRHVSAMIAAGLLRERPDLVAAGAVGRPRVPFEVDHESHLTVGIHIGAVVTSVITADLRGRILGAIEIPTPRGASDAALATITASARGFAARWHRRRRCGSASRSVAASNPRPDWWSIRGSGGRGPASVTSSGRGSVSPSRWRRTWRRWRRPSCCSLHNAPTTPTRAAADCTSTPVKPSVWH